MLLPVKMCYAYAIVHRDVGNKVLESLHREGFMQMEYLENHSFLKKLERIDVEERFREAYTQMDSVRAVYSRVGRRKGDLIKSILHPPEKIKFPAERMDGDALLKKVEEFMDDVGKEILAVEEKLEKIEGELETLKTHRKWVRNLLNLEFNLKYLGDSPYLYIRAGFVKDLEILLEKTAKLPVAIWYSEIKQKKKTVGWNVVILALHKNRKEVESALRFASFEEYDLRGYEGKPNEVLKKIEERISSLTEERKNLLNIIKKSKEKNWEKFAKLWDELYNHRQREIARNKMLGTKYCDVIGGWIRKRDLEKFRKVVEESSEGLAVVKWREAKDGEDVPVDYDNPRFIRPFQAFIDMFSPPKYRDIEPTVIVAIAFIIFFGLTLGDAFYGLILLVGSILLLRAGKTSWTYRTLGKIMIPCSISTIIFGFLGGNFMGPLDERNPWVRFFAIFGVKIPTDIKYPLDSIRDPIFILLISLIIGLFFIILGITLGAYQDLKRRNYLTFIQGRVSWYLLIPFGGALIGEFFGWWGLSGTMKLVSIILSLVGLCLLFEIPDIVIKFRSGEIKGVKAKVGYVLGKIMNFFDITGFIGNWLSYARLLALSLATAGLAMTINVLADIITSMFGNLLNLLQIILGVIIIIVGKKFKPFKKFLTAIGILEIVVGATTFFLGFSDPTAMYFGFAIFFVLFYTVTHLGNAVLQALGSFVHSLRLQYVEFFSQFYEGGGRKFSPFRERRVYTYVEVKK